MTKNFKSELGKSSLLRKATYVNILEAEQLILLETHKRYRKAFAIFIEAIDVLLMFSYNDWIIPADQESDEYQFYVHVRHLYYAIPASFRSCISLIEGGHYDDAYNCLRSVLESLVKYKFLLQNKDKILLYETDGKDSSKQKVTISRAFKESCGAGVMEKVYRLGSRFEHKNFAANLPFLRARLNKEESYSLVPTFHQHLCEGGINYLAYLLFGFLNLANHFFAIQWSDREIQHKYDIIKSRLAHVLLDRRSSFPKAIEWNLAMERVVCVDLQELESAAQVNC